MIRSASLHQPPKVTAFSGPTRSSPSLDRSLICIRPVSHGRDVAAPALATFTIQPTAPPFLVGGCSAPDSPRSLGWEAVCSPPTRLRQLPVRRRSRLLVPGNVLHDAALSSIGPAPDVRLAPLVQSAPPRHAATQLQLSNVLHSSWLSTGGHFTPRTRPGSDRSDAGPARSLIHCSAWDT